MKRMLVCFTGGTFTSKIDKNVMDVSSSASSEFIDIIEKKYGGEIEFIYLNIVFMLSENMYPEVWEKITFDINDKLSKDKNFDGIILIHGSDTASYTMSFLSHYYKNLPIPIVVTAANAPIDNPHSNGLNNFNSSISFILKNKVKGTYFSYQHDENRGEKYIYKSDELIEANIYTNEFECVNFDVFGRIEKNEVILRDKLENSPDNIETWNFYNFEYKNKVLGIKPYLGLDYSVFNLESNNIKAVVHSLYHSNTHNCNDDKGFEDYSLIEFIKKCEKIGIDIYLSDFPKDRLEKPIYESTSKLIKLEATLIYAPFENVYTKAIYVYNSDIESKKQFMME